MVTCGGIPAGRSTPASWRRLVTWVPQKPHLLNESVAANIGFGRAGASREDIVHAARLAHADEFVRALPRGYDTVIGEQGAQVSGGQVQRIALARAFIKDAPLLILDEATSSLDVENAALVQDAIDRLMRNRTVLLITHRLNTIASADCIVVLDAGHVVACGTHAALSPVPGIYRDLIRAGRPEAS
jgi:ABC-type multidrug transport system fused ATPase/permease subunit